MNPNTSPICFLSLERRINFCFNEKQQRWGQFALEFEYFISKLQERKDLFQFNQLKDWKSKIGHFFWRHYQRVDELELFELKLLK